VPIDVQLAVHRLMSQTKTKLHKEGERHGDCCRGPQARGMRGQCKESETSSELNYGKCNIQPAGDGIPIRAGLLDESTLRYCFAPSEWIRIAF
jgi:hypothetical protein